MELTFEYQIEEAVAKKRLRRVYNTIHALEYVRNVLYLILFCVCAVLLQKFMCVFLIMAFLFSISIISAFPRLWRFYRQNLAEKGAFEYPTMLHITDTFIEVSRGGNSAKVEYRLFTNYLDIEDGIALLKQDLIVTAVPKSIFVDGGKEYIQCLENAGVRKFQTHGFKRWRGVCTPIILMPVICLGYIATENHTKAIFEKFQRQNCVSHLKQLTNALHVYSYGNTKMENKPQHFPPLQILIDMIGANQSVDGLASCPKSHTEYVYVQYDKPVALTPSITAANTPVLFDNVIGCHRISSKASFLGFGTEIHQTVIAFEDGHVSVEENLTCHKDIYDKYASFMSEKDAEVLLKCCEEADKWGKLLNRTGQN